MGRRGRAPGPVQRVFRTGTGWAVLVADVGRANGWTLLPGGAGLLE